MHARLRRLAEDPLQREAGFLIGNALLGAATGFLFWLVAARTLDAASVGRGAAVVSAFSLAALLGKLGFDAVLVRHVPALGAAARRRLLTRALALVAAASALVAVVLAHLTAVEDALLFVAFAVAVGAGWVLDAWFIAIREARASFARNAVFNAGRLALVAVPAVGVATAWGVAAALSLVFAVALPRRAAGSAPLPDTYRTTASNFVVNVSEFLPALAFPILVAANLGAEANAVFYVAWTLAAVPFLASKAIAQSTFAELSGGDRRTALRRGARMHAWVMAPAVLLGLLAGPAVLAFYGERYLAGLPALVVLLLALAPASVNNLAIASLKAADRPRALVGFTSTLLTLTLVGGAILLAPFGILGPALAWCAANLALLVWSVPIVFVPQRSMSHARFGDRAHEG